MEQKKKYTRSEKLQYYATLIANLELRLKSAKERFEWIASDKYQEWDGELAKELAAKKAAE